MKTKSIKIKVTQVDDIVTITTVTKHLADYEIVGLLKQAILEAELRQTKDII